MVRQGRHDPNNTHWANDKGRLGFKLLEKMGWSEGKGLGKDLGGMTEHIRVQQKEDQTGLGSKLDVNAWKSNTFNYESTLKKLSEEHKKKKNKASPRKRRRATSGSDTEKSDTASEGGKVYVPKSPKMGAAVL
eukprot:Sspe_Gene.113487::Locus_97825_Transcript_1_1_Confidence_1.000_Length_466::g.113487::m.113487/K11135/PINX1; Pin2-interacting protein X1